MRLTSFFHRNLLNCKAFYDKMQMEINNGEIEWQ